MGPRVSGAAVWGPMVPPYRFGGLQSGVLQSGGPQSHHTYLWAYSLGAYSPTIPIWRPVLHVPVFRNLIEDPFGFWDVTLF